MGQLDVTGLPAAGHERIYGVHDAMIDYAPFFNPAANRVHAVLSTLPRTDRVTTFLVADSQGAAAFNLSGKQVNYDGTRAPDGALTFATNNTGNGFSGDWGVVLTDDGITTSTATEDLGSLDTVTVETTFGLQAYLHVIAATNLTSADITIEDSADDSAWAAVTGAAFATVAAAPASERIAVAGTVRRYLRVAITLVGDSITYLVTVTRNPVATVL